MGELYNGPSSSVVICTSSSFCHQRRVILQKDQAATYLDVLNGLAKGLLPGRERSMIGKVGDLDPTMSGLSHLPPSSERMGHYLCIGVQETIRSSHFMPSPLRSEGRDNLENRGSFPGTDT